MKYEIYFVNFGYFANDVYKTFEAALEKAKSTGFECAIQFEKRTVAYVRTV
jgi:hypothetical protein